jgi:hypothetical protein
LANKETSQQGRRILNPNKISGQSSVGPATLG